MKTFVKYAVAVVGAAFVFIGVFFVWGALINPFLPEIFRASVRLGWFETNNWPGTVLGMLAAGSSFRATLRKYGKTSSPRQR